MRLRETEIQVAATARVAFVACGRHRAPLHQLGLLGMGSTLIASLIGIEMSQRGVPGWTLGLIAAGFAIGGPDGLARGFVTRSPANGPPPKCLCTTVT